MTLFLDTSDLDLIKKYYKFGAIRGVTTNPSIILQNSSKNTDVNKNLKEIANYIKPYNLSLEVTSNDHSQMIEEAKFYNSLGKNISVKITIHGPEEEEFNLEVINVLENKENIRVNVTAMMNAQQCLLAAYAGATYVSLFGGRVNDIGGDAIHEIVKLRNVLNINNLKAKIIVGSVRETSNIFDWLNAGAHIVTVPPQFIKKMQIHPHTTNTVKQFLNDAKKIKS